MFTEYVQNVCNTFNSSLYDHKIYFCCYFYILKLVSKHVYESLNRNDLIKLYFVMVKQI